MYSKINIWRTPCYIFSVTAPALMLYQLKFCPCPSTRDWGSHVSGFVFLFFQVIKSLMSNSLSFATEYHSIADYNSRRVHVAVAVIVAVVSTFMIWTDFYAFSRSLTNLLHIKREVAPGWGALHPIRFFRCNHKVSIIVEAIVWPKRYFGLSISVSIADPITV